MNVSRFPSLVDKYLNKVSRDDKRRNTELLFSLCCHSWNEKTPIFWYKNRLASLETKGLDLISGFICFLGGLLFCRTVTGKLQYIQELFRYSTLYLILDHYIDDPKISQVGKRKLIKVMSRAMMNGGKTDAENLTDSKIHDMINGIRIILDTTPNSLPNLRQIYEEQMRTYRLQSIQDLTREEYLSFSLNKGGYTVKAIESLIGLSPTEGAHDLGACIQLDDDLRDVMIDMKNKINTIATYDYRVNGNLDDLAFELVTRIDALEEKYWLFKAILMTGLIHTVVTNSYFSTSLRNELEEYLLIDKNITFEIIQYVMRNK